MDYKYLGKSFSFVVLLLPMILLGAFIAGMWQTSVHYENGTLHITGVYGKRIPRSEIRSVSLEDTLPSIAFRSNGFAAVNVRKGAFRTTDGRTVKLFLSSNEAPYLHVQTLEGEDIYINAATPDELHELYSRLAE